MQLLIDGQLQITFRIAPGGRSGFSIICPPDICNGKIVYCVIAYDNDHLIIIVWIYRNILDIRRLQVTREE